MKPSAALVRAIRVDPEAYAVSGEAAVRFVNERRAAGSSWSIRVSGILAMAGLGMASAAPDHPSAWILALMLSSPLAVAVQREWSSRGVTRSLADIARLRLPATAMLIDHVLVVGEPGTPVDTWSAVPVSPAEERQIRALALPGATIVRK